MNEKTDEIKPLYMPAGLKMRKEYFQGFGKEELIPAVISAIVFCMMDAFLFMFGIRDVSILFFFPVLGVTAVVFMHIKGELNLSPIDIVRQELQFGKGQKIYPYVAKNEWESIEEVEL